MRVIGAIVLIVASLPIAAQSPVEVGDVNGYILAKEKALGQQLADEVRLKATALDSPRVQEYLDRLGRKIAPHIQGARVDYTFNLVADDTGRTHEPFALPGGVIFVSAALFTSANDEAEFAGMLAHSMEHVVQRHPISQGTMNRNGNLATIPLIFMGSSFPTSDAAIPLAMVSQVRNNELEADASAVETLAHAGFDPAALVRYIEREPPAAPGAVSRVFSTLPERDQRIAALNSAIARLPQASFADPGPEFDAIRSEVQHLVAALPEGPRFSRGPPTLQRDRPTLKREQ